MIDSQIRTLSSPSLGKGSAPGALIWYAQIMSMNRSGTTKLQGNFCNVLALWAFWEMEWLQRLKTKRSYSPQQQK